MPDNSGMEPQGFSENSRLRASDADRDRAAAVINHAMAEGRLTADEHSERLDAIYAARTHADIVRLIDDLPGQALAATAGAQAPAQVDPGPAGSTGSRRSSPGQPQGPMAGRAADGHRHRVRRRRARLPRCGAARKRDHPQCRRRIRRPGDHGSAGDAGDRLGQRHPGRARHHRRYHGVGATGRSDTADHRPLRVRGRRGPRKDRKDGKGRNWRAISAQ